MAWALTNVCNATNATGIVVEGTDPSIGMSGHLADGSGGILLMILTCRTAPTSVGTPTGWTKIVNNVQGITVFARVSDGEADDTPTVTVTGAAQTSHCFMSRWTGGNTTLASLLDASATPSATPNGSQATVNYINAREITPSVDNCLVIRGGRVNDDIGVVTGFSNTSLLTRNINVTNDMMIGYEYAIQTTAATVAAGQLTTGGTTNTEYSAAFALTASEESTPPEDVLLIPRRQLFVSRKIIQH